MKRKIAILLSAMMVTSAMPMTASAAHLKGDSVLNATFAKSNETIDANANKYAGYTTVDELKSRKSVLKVMLKDDNTNNISDKVTFKVELENGTFDENNKDRYAYKNSNDKVTFKVELENGTFDENNKDRYAYKNSNNLNVLDYDTAMDGASSLEAVYKNIAKTNVNSTNIQIGADKVIASETGYTDLNTAIGTLVQEDFNAGENQIKDKATFMAHPKIAPAIANLKKAIIEQYTQYVPELPHIPYEIEINNPTTATITVPNLNLSVIKLLLK